MRTADCARNEAASDGAILQKCEWKLHKHVSTDPGARTEAGSEAEIVREVAF